MTDTIFRVYPFLNIARVGNSKDGYYIAPETAAGHVVPGTDGVYGGLPIKAGTDKDFIEEDDLRDANGDLRRQAARFRVYAFDGPQTSYPGTDAGREIKIGDTVTVDGETKTVKDIVWTVHVANKKANNYVIAGNTDILPNWDAPNRETELGIVNYENGKTPPIRNPAFGPDLDSDDRRRKLVIDPGPRCVSASGHGAERAEFDATSNISFYHNGITEGNIYPISFPSMHFPEMAQPLGQIDTLGEIMIEEGTGRLLFLGGYGKAEAIVDPQKACADPTNPDGFDAIDNNCWFDDTSDGPVNAAILFKEGGHVDAVGGWVVCTDPGFAPQVRNVVSAWDDMFDSWVRNLDLIPDLYSKKDGYNQSYRPHFDSELQPIFHGALLQRWTTALPSQAINGHNFMGAIQQGDDPTQKMPNFEDLIRDPAATDNDGLVPMNYEGTHNDTKQTVKMPLALGDTMRSFLTLSPTQYFFMKQWHEKKSTDAEPGLNEGEALDRAVLENCLGGRYSPGIDVTFIIRDVNLYVQDWRGATGPFRINQDPLNYRDARPDNPFLAVGYVPLRDAKVQPGDISKFMSIPWHTDYNSCAIHEPDPNPQVGASQGGDPEQEKRGPMVEANTLYWSWPAQRPVQIYPKEFCTYDANAKTWKLGAQLFSVRGEGTLTPYPQHRGAYQNYFEFIKDWHKVGFVLQGTQVSAATDQGGSYGKDIFVEVKSLFDDTSDPVTPWPSGFNSVPEHAAE